MKAVRCAFCGLLTTPSNELGNLKVAVAGNHEPREVDGFALTAETPVCIGSQCLGRVIPLSGDEPIQESGDFTVIGIEAGGTLTAEERVVLGLTPANETTQGLHEDVGDAPECEEFYREVS